MTRTSSFEVIVNPCHAETAPADRDPAQWHQAIGVARQVCARIFRDGGKPADAVGAFDVAVQAPDRLDWSRAVELVAGAMCEPGRRAA